jgi:hypothetical protein
MDKLGLAAAAVSAAIAISPAFAGMGMQGPQLTGAALQSPALPRPVAVQVTLPSGEIIGLGRPAADKSGSEP